MSTPGLFETVVHQVSEGGSEAMVSAMHAHLDIATEELRAGMPAQPAVALYCSGGQFHAFWYSGLSQAEQARIAMHLEAHHHLGDLRPVEGFFWTESLGAGQPTLADLDERNDTDPEARTLRFSLRRRLGQDLTDLLARPDAAARLSAVAEAEHLDIAVVCAWAATDWSHPCWLDGPGLGQWRNRAASEEPLPAPDAVEWYWGALALRHHYFDQVRFTVALPVELARATEPPAAAPADEMSLEALFGDGDTFVEMGEELLLPDLAVAPQVDEEESLEMLFGAGPTPDAPVAPAPLPSLEALFGPAEPTAPVEPVSLAKAESPSLESLFNPPESVTTAAGSTATKAEVPSLEALFGPAEPALPTEPAPIAKAESPSLEALFGPAEASAAPTPAVSPVAKAESPSLEALFGPPESVGESPSLEALFAPTPPPAAPATKAESPSLEALFGPAEPALPTEPAPSARAEAPSLESLFGPAEVPATPSTPAAPASAVPPVTRAEAPSLESLFAPAEEPAKAVSPAEPVEAPVPSAVLDWERILYGEQPPAAPPAAPAESPSLASLFGPSEPVVEVPSLDALFDSPPPADAPAAPAESPSLASLFGEEPQTAIPGELPAAATPESAAGLDALDALPGETLEPAAVAPVSRTLVSYIDSCDGLPVLSEALACARRLDWLSAEAPEAIVARLAAYAAHLECRVLLCPAPGVPLAQIESAVGPLPPHVQLKIGFGLPTGHSLYVLTDAHDNQVFFHQQPGEGEATLIASWSAPPAVEEIGWRRRRFELLWEDQLRPLVRVEPLGPSLESLFALS